MQATSLEHTGDCWRGRFHAMATPCEVLMDVVDEALAGKILHAVSDEVWRIEKKFSRYLDNNIIHKINNAAGAAVVVDEEVARLIDFSDELYRLSDGMFDITSGVLRKVWNFDGSDSVPEASAVVVVLKNIGWQKVEWKSPVLTMPGNMEIDLGGIGKEYAVDRCVQIAHQLCDESVLINLGGDLAVTRPRKNNAYWAVGRLITGKDHAVALFELRRGAIATSGDAHRYLLKDGVRYSHVLNPKTGWPVQNAPHTVSVAAPTCVEAGMLSTMAMLHGDSAQAFLERQEINFWID